MSLDLPWSIREVIKQIPFYCKVVDIQSEICFQDSTAHNTSCFRLCSFSSATLSPR